MRFSLRSRVLAATLGLVLLGLAVASVATYVFLRSFLMHRLDQQLVSSEAAAEHVLREQLQFGESDQGGPASGLPIGTYVGLLDVSGKQITHTTPGYPGSNAAPALPPDLPGSAGSTQDQTVFTAGDVTGGPSFRVMAFRVGIGPPGSSVPGTLLVAIPFSEITGTLHRLVLVEVLVSLGVLVAVGGVGWWLVRRGLRPLDRMAETADDIAAGDLSKRVSPDDQVTEVGRLGHALNTMLGQIEEAFAEQRASEARLRRFVADASHELRTPVTSIRGYAELFRRGASARPDDLERAMRRIEDEGARMGEVVDDLLSLARLDQGRPLEREPVDLTSVVVDAVDDLHAAEPDRPLEFTPNGAVVVSGDESGLRQVVANLMENVRTHTPEGTPVSVMLRGNGATATLAVSDRGPGLTADEAAHVFERFYRGDPSRSRESGGTGLGLSIAAAIVAAHGGTIRASGRDGGGATFEVSLPLAEGSV